MNIYIAHIHKLFIGLISLFVFLPLQAHIGSPNVIYEGKAGPYDVLVNIQPPEVVPGLAQISVRAPEGIDAVKIQVVYYRAGGDRAPEPEAIASVPGDAQLYNGQVWLMALGSASVRIVVDGWQGPGSTVVPVPSLPTAQMTMDRELSIVLLILGAILFFGAATLIYASVGEALLPVGEKLAQKRKWRALGVAVLATGLFGFLVWGGQQWWNQEAKRYERYMYRPVELETSLTQEALQHKLQLHLKDEGHIDRKPGDLVPDHGKLMHLFLISENDKNIFAHLHPLKIDSVNFESLLPQALPPGTYTAYADIVHQRGLTETLVHSFELPKAPVENASAALKVSSPISLKSDTDDSWYAFQAYQNHTQYLPNGLKLIFEQAEDKVFRAGQIESLQFSLETAEGIPAVIEPYLSMLGHAAVVKDDDSVFIHLHPVGTVSMAAQEVMAGRIKDDLLTLCVPIDSISNLAALERFNSPNQVTNMRQQVLKLMEERGLSHKVSFPYAFPRAGKYRMWVQVKYKGEILTGGFDIEVEDAIDTV